MTPDMTLDKLNEKLGKMWPNHWPGQRDRFGFTGFKARQDSLEVHGQLLDSQDCWRDVVFDLGGVLNDPEQVIFEKACEAIRARQKVEHGGVWNRGRL